jgi:arginyl-tRNA synthetase
VNSARQGTVATSTIRQFAVAYVRHEQDLDRRLRALQQVLPGVQLAPVRSGRGALYGPSQKRAADKTFERRCAVAQVRDFYGDDKDRVMKDRRQLHLLC